MINVKANWAAHLDVNAFAEVLIHEGTHGLDSFPLGRNPQSKAEETATESNAYTNQSYVAEGLGAASRWGVWSPGITDADRQKAIKDEVQKSVRLLVPERGQLQVTTVPRVRLLRLWLLPILALPALSQQPALPTNGGAKPIATTLCDVVAHPESFADKRVKFQASFVSDGLDHSVLTHAGCKLGIVPYPAADDRRRPDVEKFQKAIEEGAPGTADKTVVAIFTGRFVWKPPSKRILEIEGVSQLHVSPVSGSPGRPKR